MPSYYDEDFGMHVWIPGPRLRTRLRAWWYLFRLRMFGMDGRQD